MKSYFTKLIEAFVELHGIDVAPHLKEVEFRHPIKVVVWGGRTMLATDFAIQGKEIVVELTSEDRQIDGACRLDDMSEKYHDVLLTALVEAIS